jgi:hypothetical protein
VGLRGGGLAGATEQVVRWRVADEDGLRLLGAYRDLRDPGDPEAGPADAVPLENGDGGDADGGVITDLPLEL